jgi:hypothetical protein
LKIDQTDRYTIPPESGTPQPEWHLSAETNEQRPMTHVLSVLGISRAGEKIALSDVEDIPGDRRIAVRFRRSGKAVRVSFDTEGPAVRVD